MIFRNEYYFLSNFYPCTIKVNGYVFTNAEAAFQAMKCTNELDVIALTKMNGADAKSFGRRISLRSDWNSFRLKAMCYVLTCKFTQNPDLLAKLKQISVPIVEDNIWNDKFWGRCNGAGENHLGIILENLKQKL